MSENIVVTGVVSNHSPEWLTDDVINGVDLDYEAHCCDCVGQDGYHDDCWLDDSQDTVLIGFAECQPDDPDAWFSHIGACGSLAYKLDPAASYSAIVGEVYTQVVASKWAQSCRLCSPCYPNQGDLDSVDGNIVAYTLPPDVWGHWEPEGVREVKS